jgi:hypothetical protein
VFSVSTTLTKPKAHGRTVRATAKKSAPSRFWVRPASRELDRAGDFILRNLPAIRREADSRAGAA